MYSHLCIWQGCEEKLSTAFLRFRRGREIAFLPFLRFFPRTFFGIFFRKKCFLPLFFLRFLRAKRREESFGLFLARSPEKNFWTPFLWRGAPKNLWAIS